MLEPLLLVFDLAATALLLLAMVALVFFFSDEFLRSIRDLMNFLTTTAIPITATTTMNVSAGPVVGSDPSSLVTGTMR